MSVVSEGVLNDPSNKSLRFDILRYGLETFCAEMQGRSIPIRMQDAAPITGRFFASGCSSQIIDDPSQQSVIVRYQGNGYGWTNMTQRLGFSSTGSINYAVDFVSHQDRLYVYFRPRRVSSATFQATLVESALAQVGIALSGMSPDTIGRNLIKQQLERGFTVIRHPGRGETEFSLGILARGQRPHRPFSTESSSWTALANTRTSIQWNQQDYVRGIHIPGSHGRLRVTARLEGPGGLDLLVVRDADGLQMVQRYVHVAGPAPLLRAPSAELNPRRGQPVQSEFQLAGGNYFLILDHSGAAGRSTPPPGEPPATLDYLIEVTNEG